MKKRIKVHVGLSILCGIILSICILSGLTFAFSLATMKSAGSFYPSLVSGGATLLLAIVYAVVKLLSKMAYASNQDDHNTKTSK